LKKIASLVLIIFFILVLVAVVISIPIWYQSLSDYEIINGKIIYITEPQTRTFEIKNLKNISVQYVTVLIETDSCEHILLESHDGVEHKSLSYEYSDGLEDCKLISSMELGRKYSFLLDRPTLGGQYKKIISYVPISQ
jgi:hypothetical protein